MQTAFMTTSSTQIPLQMRREDLPAGKMAEPPETSALEQLLVAEPFPEHGAYLGPGGWAKSHLLQACCEAHGHHARYVPLREFGGFPPDKVVAGAETARYRADGVDTIAESQVWQGLVGFFNLCGGISCAPAGYCIGGTSTACCSRISGRV